MGAVAPVPARLTVQAVAERDLDKLDPVHLILHWRRGQNLLDVQAADRILQVRSRQRHNQQRMWIIRHWRHGHGMRLQAGPRAASLWFSSG